MARQSLLSLCGAVAALIASSCWSGPLTVTRVWPERIVYRPGETATIDVDLANPGNAAVTANVAIEVRHGLDAKDETQRQAVTVPAGGNATARFRYAVPKGRKWGHEAMATLTDDRGVVQSTGHEYFTVGENPWELGHYMTLFWIRGKKKDGSIDSEILPRFRKGYVTTIEAYSWEPSVFDNMAPNMEVWRSGQGDYKEGKEDWQYLVERAHAMGMAVVTYIQSVSYGPYGLEFVRRHPDWLVYGEDGRPQGWFDVDKLAALQENPEAEAFIPDSGGFTAGVFLPSRPQVGDYWIREVMRSKEMFKWDGFRSDGNPSVAGGRDYVGKLHEVKDLDAANAEFIEKARRKLTEKYPSFLFGWNYPVCDTMGGGYGLKGMPKQLEKMIPGSYMLWEAFNSAGQPSSVLHNWRRMAQDLHCEVENIRKRGGFSHVGWMGSNRYLEAVASACGSHTDSWGGGSAYPNYRRFQFRWAEFLWDSKLRHVQSGADAVSAEAPPQVWWQDFVHTCDLPEGGQRVIVHLLNMPANDDEGWADRPPAPVANVRVAFKVPPGKRLTKVVALSPDTEGDVVTVTPVGEGSVSLPQVTVWSMVAAEFASR